MANEYGLEEVGGETDEERELRKLKEDIGEVGVIKRKPSNLIERAQEAAYQFKEHIERNKEKHRLENAAKIEELKEDLANKKEEAELHRLEREKVELDVANNPISRAIGKASRTYPVEFLRQASKAATTAYKKHVKPNQRMRPSKMESGIGKIDFGIRPTYQTPAQKKFETVIINGKKYQREVAVKQKPQSNDYGFGKIGELGLGVGSPGNVGAIGKIGSHPFGESKKGKNQRWF